MGKRKPRTRYQQIAAAVSFEAKLNATLVRVFRKHNKLHFTFQHKDTKKKWTTTLSKLENYGHNKFVKGKQKKTYWRYSEWKEAGETSKYFSGFKFYIIQCKDKYTNESFYKIGRTFHTLDSRFNKSFPYEYRILKVVEGSAYDICKMEERFLRENKPNQYVPQKPFSGMYECFSKLTKETHAD